MAQQFNHDALDAWLTLHHPATIRRMIRPELSDTLSMLAAADTSPIAPSQACLTGSGAAAAKADTDWASNPALGAINVAQMARNKAGYNPTDLNNAGAQSTQYLAYLKNLSTCPMFVVMESDSQNVTQTSSDWNTVINALADTFEGIADKDKNAIKNGLTNLAQAASSKMSTTQTQAVFVQNVINVDDVISYYLYSSNATFIETKGKGYDTKQSTFTVVRLRLQFQTALWPQYWARVKAAFDGSFDDWFNDNSTSTAGTTPIKALS